MKRFLAMVVMYYGVAALVVVLVLLAMIFISDWAGFKT